MGHGSKPPHRAIHSGLPLTRRTSQCCLQVIGLLKDAFFKAGLELYLAPYGVLPTGFECGIIEVVPEANSRSALG